MTAPAGWRGRSLFLARGAIPCGARTMHERGMDRTQQLVVLITGASSGIGRACAEHLHARGHRVFGASRRTISGASFQTITMDVDDDESVRQGIAAIVQREGRIDAVVNNAGFAVLGAVEDTSVAEAKQQLETNFFGVLRVINAVLPKLRAQGGGRIVNVSSLGGIFGMPYSGLYSASKFAVEGLSEALRMELKPFRIHVSLIEPGDFRTELTVARRRTAASLGPSAHASGLARAMQAAEKDEKAAPTPEPIAELLERVLLSNSPRLRYTVGMFSQRVVTVLKRFLPARLFEWILAQAFQIPAPGALPEGTRAPVRSDA
jgi:NAD(P)-dependent dehydrogenase (short-subunit alcohol dehydrogenase family)